VTFNNLLEFENFLLLLGIVFAFQFVDRSFGPVLPLHVAATGTPGADVPFVSGVLFSILACAAALGHHFCAVLLRHRSPRIVISRATLGAAAAAGLFTIARATWLMGVAAAVFGLSVGAATTAAYTVAAGVIPAHVRGAGFGFLTSSSLTGMALSPMVSGVVAATDIRMVFGADAAVLCVVAVLVGRVMIDRTGDSASPPVEDA
jgi:MFS family permease